MSPLDLHLYNAFEQGESYIDSVKKNVKFKYRTVWNSCLYLVVWRKFLSKGNLQLKGKVKIKLSLYRYTLYYILWQTIKFNS